MPIARKYQINLEATAYYHCVSRCVRRAYLCGKDNHTGNNYEHRRRWIESRLLSLSSAFAINICAYAIMSNHYHVVCHIDQDKALRWNQDEVIARWQQCHKHMPALVNLYLAGEPLSEMQVRSLADIVEKWRTRLYCLSEFMKTLNSEIAKLANQEDQCSGHFWEGRFKSQALLDEKALAAAMAYVDLNPVRANIADSPEHSDHTSVKHRIQCLKTAQSQPPSLHPFTGNPTNHLIEGIPFKLLDYLALVDWTARQYHQHKASIDNAKPPILSRLGINTQEWLKLTSTLEKRDSQLIGTRDAISAALAPLNRKRIRGQVLAA